MEGTIYPETKREKNPIFKIPHLLLSLIVLISMLSSGCHEFANMFPSQSTAESARHSSLCENEDYVLLRVNKLIRDMSDMLALDLRAKAWYEAIERFGQTVRPHFEHDYLFSSGNVHFVKHPNSLIKYFMSVEDADSVAYYTQLFNSLDQMVIDEFFHGFQDYVIDYIINNGQLVNATRDLMPNKTWYFIDHSTFVYNGTIKLIKRAEDIVSFAQMIDRANHGKCSEYSNLGGAASNRSIFQMEGRYIPHYVYRAPIWPYVYSEGKHIVWYYFLVDGETRDIGNLTMEALSSSEKDWIRMEMEWFSSFFPNIEFVELGVSTANDARYIEAQEAGYDPWDPTITSGWNYTIAMPVVIGSLPNTLSHSMVHRGSYELVSSWPGKNFEKWGPFWAVDLDAWNPLSSRYFIHDILHVLGLEHETARADRDDYIDNLAGYINDPAWVFKESHWLPVYYLNYEVRYYPWAEYLVPYIDFGFPVNSTANGTEYFDYFSIMNGEPDWVWDSGFMIAKEDQASECLQWMVFQGQSIEKSVTPSAADFLTISMMYR